MFGIGVQELLIILVVALLVLGPTRLPAAAKALAKGIQEMRRASDDLRQAFLFDDADPPPRPRWTPHLEDSPRSPASPQPVQPGGAALVASQDDEELLVRPVPVDDLVPRGEEGGDPHKRAHEPSSASSSRSAERGAGDDDPRISTIGGEPSAKGDVVSLDIGGGGAARKEPLS